MGAGRYAPWNFRDKCNPWLLHHDERFGKLVRACEDTER